MIRKAPAASVAAVSSPEASSRSRRQFLRAAGVAVLAGGLPPSGSAGESSGAESVAEDRRIRIDALSDAQLDEEGFDAIERSKLTMIQTSVGTAWGPVDTPAYTYDAALSDLVKWHGHFARHRDKLLHVRRGDDILQAHREGKLAVMLGFQNGTHLNRDIRNVQFFYDLGVRNIQLTYNQLNALGAGCTEPVDPGLSDFGVRVVEELNQLGIAVDLSHCGVRTTLDGIEASKKPALITHSNCRALNDNPRCKSDEEIHKLAAKGGVIGITTVDFYLTSKPSATVDDVVAHIEHVVRLVGIDHVGIGSDTPIGGMRPYYPTASVYLEKQKTPTNFAPAPGERWPLAVEELDVPEKLLRIEQRLAQRGFSETAIDQVMGGNFLRVYREVLG